MGLLLTEALLRDQVVLHGSSEGEKGSFGQALLAGSRLSEEPFHGVALDPSGNAPIGLPRGAAQPTLFKVLLEAHGPSYPNAEAPRGEPGGQHTLKLTELGSHAPLAERVSP